MTRLERHSSHRRQSQAQKTLSRRRGRGRFTPPPKDGKLLPESKILRRQPGPITDNGAEQDTEGDQKAHRRLRLEAKPGF